MDGVISLDLMDNIIMEKEILSASTGCEYGLIDHDYLELIRIDDLVSGNSVEMYTDDSNALIHDMFKDEIDLSLKIERIAESLSRVVCHQLIGPNLF